ncbi:ribbon-helix-helix protein, CopG family [Candidatus Daviesbacteria bacterium]|nr:ribbon-helix-helix protein, CopG family [Candidatus Daviesbacteria bacterium]
MQTQQRAIINISVPRAIEKEIIRMAKEENKTKSELLRDAFRIYKWRKNWAKIRAWGEETARRMGIESYDDIERIAE